MIGQLLIQLPSCLIILAYYIFFFYKNGVSIVRRIQAVKDFGTVEAGELGGWIKGEGNLSHFGNCWVSGDAQVSDNAQVYGDARVSDNAWVRGSAQVYNNAKVYGNAWVSNNVQVSEDAHVYDLAQVSGDAVVRDNALVSGNAQVDGDAQIEAPSDVITITNVGSRSGTTTFYKNKHGGISVICGCFEGTLEKFEEAVLETHGDSKYGRVYQLAIKMAKEQIELD